MVPMPCHLSMDKVWTRIAPGCHHSTRNIPFQAISSSNLQEFMLGHPDLQFGLFFPVDQPQFDHFNPPLLFFFQPELFKFNHFLSLPCII
eukprot:Gb_06842 [translate_table: standard]